MQMIAAKMRQTGAGDLTKDFFTFDQGVRRQAAGMLSLYMLLIAVGQRVIYLLTAPITVTARLVHARPWIIEARGASSRSEPHRWPVIGWDNSARFIEDLAATLEHGKHPPPPATRSRGKR